MKNIDSLKAKYLALKEILLRSVPMKSLLVMTVLLCVHLPVSAQQETESGKPLKVGLNEFPPFVIPSDEGPVGFDVDYIKAICGELNQPVEFVGLGSIEASLGALDRGEVDWVAGGISMTPKREVQFDFSHAHYQSGLSIMVPKNRQAFFSNLVTALKDKSIMLTLGSFFLFITLSGIVFWIFERRQFAASRNALSSFGEGMWLSYATATTIGYGDVTPRTLMGRMATIPISLIGFIVIGSISGLVSTLLTMEQLEDHVLSLPDLQNKLVAYKSGSAFDTKIQDYADTYRFRLMAVPSSDMAYEMLARGGVDAYLYDAPGLLYHASGEGRDLFHVVGGIFDRHMYAIAMRESPPRLEKIRQIQLQLHEEGLLDELNHRYGL